MKRIAVLSDIHGNSWALDAVTADLRTRQVDLIISLGDTVWGSLDPAGTIDRLQIIGALNITGNQDRTLWEEPDSADRAYARESLGAERLRWLREQPATRVVGDLFLCHGTPAHDDQYLLTTVTPQGVGPATVAEVESRLAGVTQPVVLCGHSHLPAVVWLPSGRLVVNPGSVGIPAYEDDLPYPHKMEAGSPHARYAILTQTAAGWAVEQIALPYPWQKAAAAARARGREDRARWIETGRA